MTEYLNKKLKDLLNDNLTLLSYTIDDTEEITNGRQQIQLINKNMRLVIWIDTKNKTADLSLLTGEDMDDEEWAVDDKSINY